MKRSVYVENVDKLVELVDGESILGAVLRAGVKINHVCEGMGTCGTCRIVVIEGLNNFEPRNELESERADDLGFLDKERLSCQSEFSGHIKIRIPGLKKDDLI